MTKMTLKSVLLGATASVFLLAGLNVQARAEFPEKPVEMTVLFGGTAQTIGQLLADLMSKNMANPVVAVSRTGGGGAVGYSHVQSTPADGYNMVWNSNSVSTSHYRGNMKFNYEAFTPIARVSVETPALAVSADSGWKSLEDMAKAVKAGDSKLKVGISGNGSFTHLTSAALFDKMGIADKVVYVPYGKGKAPVELLAKRVDAAVQWPGQFIPHQQAGKLSILCVTGKDRIPQLKDTPSCAEAGATDLNITMWRGLAAPAGTPADVVAKLQDAAKAAIASDEFQSAADKIGFEASFLPADEFGSLIASDDAAISELMGKLGLKK
ncbi:MAG: tripartite tricarboxylate transporter substrate binding protein [Pseudomonadota bacterium]